MNFDSDSFDLDNNDAYARWRDAKMEGYPQRAAELFVEISDLQNPSSSEREQLSRLIRKSNMALYVGGPGGKGNELKAKQDVRALGRSFGLERLDANLCSDEDAISSLSVAEGGRRGRYIPYTDRPISWHTDGYYNAPDSQIRGMVLHCVCPAARGGESAVMDPEIAYILMRDENPDLVRALMHPQAMTIPPNDEGDGVIREAQSGPVFSVSGADGSLHMRYTARTRSISWRDDAATRAAVDFLVDLLKSDSPYIFRHRMEAGQGVLCNNVLHNRTTFEDDESSQRLYLRARYFDRIKLSG